MTLRKFLAHTYPHFSTKRTNVTNGFGFIGNYLQQKMGCKQSKLDITPAKSSSNNEQSEEYVEKVVCNDTDLQENQMKQFDLDDDAKVLLVKQRGKISAIGPKCTHYGAPLVNGALGDGRIRCQWHGACFNILTGDIEDFPGLDSLPCHQVTIESDGGVRVRAKKSSLLNNKRVNAMCKRNNNEDQSIVVIGGGPAGATCVETLRQEGFEGKITLVCRENCLPYDRVKVSKAMDFEIEKAEFRDDKFYKENGIDVVKGVEATSVDSQAKTVGLANGKQLSYDRLFIATGCKPKKADVPGNDLNNVVVLRDYEDSKYTNAFLSPDKEVVVLGSSFVAMESANYCLGKVKKVTVLSRSENPFQSFLGVRIGEAWRKLFEDKGVIFIPKSGIKKCIGDDNNNVTSVELTDGSIMQADLVIMGTGSTYYTDFLKGSGINMQPDGSIECDETLQTNVPGVYTGGDIAYAPVWSHGNQKSAIGHYPLAHYHGKIAALNMLNKTKKMEAVPYFWTMLFGKGLRYAGHGAFDDIIYHGDVENLKFVAFYLKDDEAVAASSVAMDPIVSQFAEMLSQGKKISRKELEEDPLKWIEKLNVI